MAQEAPSFSEGGNEGKGTTLGSFEEVISKDLIKHLVQLPVKSTKCAGYYLRPKVGNKHLNTVMLT